jgi:hypothetical protein
MHITTKSFFNNDDEENPIAIGFFLDANGLYKGGGGGELFPTEHHDGFVCCHLWQFFHCLYDGGQG